MLNLILYNYSYNSNHTMGLTRYSGKLIVGLANQEHSIGLASGFLKIDFALSIRTGFDGNSSDDSCSKQVQCESLSDSSISVGCCGSDTVCD